MFELRQHQKVANMHLKMNDSFALFMEQGTGKTLTMLSHINYLVKRGSIRSCLIVCPKSVIASWERDIEKFNPEEQKQLNEVITVINYDMVWRGDKFNKIWDCIVLDESHFIKNRSSKRSKFVIMLSLYAKYRYILTGTPIGNSKLENLWSQYCFLKPFKGSRSLISEYFGGTYYDFLDKYCYLNQYYEPYKYRNINEFQEIMDEHCYRVLKEECLDLPEKLPDEIRYIELKEKKLYKDLIRDSVIAKYDIVADNPLTKMLKARQMLSGYIQTEEGVADCRCEKLKTLEEFLDNYDKKLVIFAQFKYSIRSISQLLDKLKIKHVILNGEQKDKAIWRKFQEDDSIQVFIGQYESAATGTDLFKADCTIYYEPTQTSNVLLQSRDRTHRIGQTHKCSYIHFITKGTIEEVMYNTLARHCDFTDRLFTEYMEEYTKSFSKKKT